MSAPNNPLAFPETPADCNGYAGSRGMSLRDWFAGQLAAAEVASAGANYEAAEALAEAATSAGMTIPQRIAFNAYEVADAMLAMRDGSADAEPLPQVYTPADPRADIDPDCVSGVSVADHNGVSCIDCYLPF